MSIRENHSIRLLHSSAAPAGVDPAPETADDPPPLEELGRQLYRLGIQHNVEKPSNDDLATIDSFTISVLNNFIDVIQLELLRLQNESIQLMGVDGAIPIPIDEKAVTPRQEEYRKIAYAWLAEIQPLTEANLRGMLELLQEDHQRAPARNGGDEIMEAGWELINKDSPAVHYPSDPTALNRFWAFGAKALAAISPFQALSLLYPRATPVPQQDAAISTSAMDIPPDSKA